MKGSGQLILAQSPKSRAWCCADVEAMVVNALFDTGSSFGLFRRYAYSGPYGYSGSYGNAPADCNAGADSDSYARAYGHTYAAADSNPSARGNPGAGPDTGARNDPGSDSGSPGPRRRPDGNFRDRSARSP